MENVWTNNSVNDNRCFSFNVNEMCCDEMSDNEQIYEKLSVQHICLKVKEQLRITGQVLKFKTTQLWGLARRILCIKRGKGYNG